MTNFHDNVLLGSKEIKQNRIFHSFEFILLYNNKDVTRNLNKKIK
jgi:hypothetical protein